MANKVLVSGVQPSGRLHIGNYFGALKQFVDLQDKYDSRFFIVDLHALTSVQDGEELRQNTIDTYIDYLAIGLDPEKCLIFKQSDTPEVTELAWIFETLTTMPYLMRAHAFKDAEAKNKEINVGKFAYPMLMAADILIHDADVVPVGQDQKQHLEIARDTAEKFNRIYGETFRLPEPLILEDVATVPGIDGQKMSKSYGNTIPLFATDEEIEKLVMSIVTDSSGDLPKNVYAIHLLLRDKDYLDKLYEKKKGKYKDLKEALIVDLKDFIRPMRERREALASDKEKVKQMIHASYEKVHALVDKKMQTVREKVGLTI
jgi:tryptophanyl-tRNA synthetase